MRRAALILLVLVAPAGAAETMWSFTPPAPYEGEADASGLSWALLVFQDGEGGIDLEVGASTYTNHTQARVKSDVLAGLTVPQHLHSSTTHLAAMRVGLSFSGWSSLLVVADDIRVHAPGRGELVAFHGNTSTAQRFTSAMPQGTWRDGVLHDVGLEPGLWHAADSTFSVEVRGLEVVEWHGARVECDAGECPDGGGTRQTEQGVGGGRVLTELRSYTRLEASGALRGNGSMHGFLGGGPGFDLVVEGEVRLPMTRAPPECGCYDPANGTVRLEGTVVMEDLSYDGGDMQAGVGGDLTSFRVDESAVDPELLSRGAKAAAGAVAAAALAVMLWKAKALAALFTRLRRDKALDHPLRRQVHEAIDADPGMTLGELVEAIGAPEGTLRYHLRRLQGLGLVKAHSSRGRMGYTVMPCREDVDLACRDADARRLEKWLRGNGPVRQRDVARQGESWGWSRSKAQDVARRLVAGKRAKTWKNGGRWYHA